jgi:CBS domain-containing protein
MFVKDVMNRKVIKASPDTSVREAARIMTDNRIGCVVVEKNGRVVGILTDRDILTALAKDGDANYDNMKISDIMTRYVIFASPGSRIEKVAETMIKHKIKKMPVIEGEKLIGIITSTDIAVAEPKIIKTIGKLLAKK